MKYVSLFSGIEAATVAWEPLGWEPACFAEFDEFPSAVLAERYPEVPNIGDVTKMNWKKYRNKVDLVVGGSPCQSFSIAGKGALVSDEVSLTLSTSNTQTLFSEEGGGMVVRRLTPRECERLQGFPDDWTKIPYRGKPAEECPDGPRYKAIGNSMAVPVMRWIGERIAMAEAGEIA